uniref:Uncharacterized protein n=1 Tax=Arundo donax TaxID=35708 RepID=A0A0A8XR22_ARUDO
MQHRGHNNSTLFSTFLPCHQITGDQFVPYN